MSAGRGASGNRSRRTGLRREPEGEAGPSAITERLRVAAPFDLYEHVGWEGRFPGLVAGVTAAGPGADFGLGTASPPTRFFEAHARLAGQLGFPLGLLARQVHGARVVRLGREPPWFAEGGAGRAEVGPTGGPHLHVAGRADGLVAACGGVLLTVTAADCVPVYLVDPRTRLLGLLHAGWRGVAAGVLERGVAVALEAGAEAGRLLLHLGPGICGDCYEVGPEVGRALGLGEAGRRTVDLREVLAERAGGLGISGDRLSRSTWCTRCARDRFHSHRGSGDEAGRMAAYLGWRSGASA